MARRAVAIIGANYGDEGKGLTTQYLAQLGSHVGKTVVVKHNGGCQSGHTVRTDDGKHHVFHQYGSATLINVPTFLAHTYIVNIQELLVESVELSRKGQFPNPNDLPPIMVDPEAILSTPYDVMLNWVQEQLRNENAHGSCGFGIHETTVRCRHPEYVTKVKDLTDIPTLMQKVVNIRDQYVDERLKSIVEAQTRPIDQKLIDNIMDRSDIILEQFMTDCLAAHNHVIDFTIPSALLAYDNVIFETGQGLILDQTLGTMPHCTPSNTGLTNIVDFVEYDGKFDSLDVVYVTRTYTTRHGNGPLECSQNHPIFHPTVDLTNVPNLFQGAIRYAPLHLENLDSYTRVDFHMTKHLDIPCRKHLMITCCDQVQGMLVPHILPESGINYGPLDEVLNILSRELQPTSIMTSYSATGSAVTLWKRCNPAIFTIPS